MKEYFIIKRIEERDGVKISTSLKWDEYVSIIKGNYLGKIPVKARYLKGKVLSDILWGGSVGVFIISEKATKVFQASMLTGWKTIPIDIETANSDLRNYNLLSVTGKSQSFDFSVGQKIKKRPVENGPLSTYYKGVQLLDDVKKDFFTTPDTLWTVINPKVKKIIEDNELSGVNLISLSEFEYDESTYLDKTGKKKS